MTFIPTQDFLIEVQKGTIGTKHSIIHKFGRNADIGTATDPQDVWNVNNDTEMVWQIAADVIDIISTSGNDDGTPTTNTGAQIVTVQGLGSDFTLQEEDVTLAGATIASTSQSFIRIYRVFVKSAGTYHGSNEGQISGVYQTSQDDAFTIAVNAGQTEMSHYTIPAATTGYLLDLSINVDTISSKTARVEMRQVTNADDVTQPFSASRIVTNFDGLSGVDVFPFAAPLKFAAKTDLWFVVRSVSSNSTPVEVDYELLLVQD